MARSYDTDLYVSIGADTSQADKKIDALFDKIQTLQHVNIDANISNLQRKLETMAKRTNAQLTSGMVNGMMKDFKVVLGAMKTEFENNGIDTAIYKSLERTCNVIESRFANLTVSIGSKQLSGLEQILNNVSELESISKIHFGDFISQDAVKNSESVTKNIKETKKEVQSLIGKIEYVSKTLEKDINSTLSEQKLKNYKQKIIDLQDTLKSFGNIDNSLIQQMLSNGAIKAAETLERISARQAIHAQEHTRTLEDVNIELKKEKENLKEIETLQNQNDAAKNALRKKREDYSGIVFQSNKPVYDTDKLKKASDSLKEFNTELDKRNKFEEKYGQLCKIIQDSYVGPYSISNGLYGSLEEFIAGSSSMKELSGMVENGIKGVPTKYINELFRSVVNNLKNEGQEVSRLINSGDVFGAQVIADLEAEEVHLGQEQNRLYEEREAQLTRINALHQEQLNLIAEQGKEEKRRIQTDLTPKIKEQIPAAVSIVQLADNYGRKLDDVNNKLMQGTALLNEQGEVLRLFHNSSEIFDTFDLTKAGSNQGQALGLGNYLALRQNGEYNDLAYGRYQTQWYANVQNPFKARDKITSEQAASIIDRFMADRADGFKNHMLSKLLDGDVIDAIKDIAEIAKTNVGEVFGHIGYDAIMDGAQLNVFDPSKIHRASASVLDIGTKEFTDFEELQNKIWNEQRIIADANNRIKELSNEYSGKTESELDLDLFTETLVKGWGWHHNVGKIGSAFKALTGRLPESENVSPESMRQLVENYEFSQQAISQWQADVKQHTEILNGLTSQLEAQKTSIDAKTQSYLTGNVSGIVNPEIPVTPVIEPKSVQAEITENIGMTPVEVPAELIIEPTEPVALPQIEEAAQQEQQLLGTAQQVTQEMSRQADAASKIAGAIQDQEELEEDLKDETDDASDETEEKIRIIQKTVDDALEQLRNAKDNKNSMIDLSSIASPSDLQKQIGDVVKTALNADLSVGDVVVADDIAKIGLYNKELGITTQQIWQLKKATDDATEAKLEFIKADPLKVDFKKAQQYTDNLKKLEDRSNSWINSQLGVLDTKERAYKYSSKKISGDTKIENFDGTAEKYIDQTLDGLAGSIKQRLLGAVDTTITEEFKNTILNDLRILENEIKVQQYKEYASTTMTPTEISEARQQFEYMLNSLEAKAKKNNVFDQVSESLSGLRDKVTKPDAIGYLTDGRAVGEFVDKLRTAKAELNAAIADEGVAKKEQQNLQNALNIQERLYKARKEYSALEIKGESESSRGMETQRRIEDLEKEYLAAEKLLKNEQSRIKLGEQRRQLENEQKKVIEEQTKIQDDKNAADVQAAKNKSIKQNYNDILDTVNKINAIDKDILKYQEKDGGTGLFAGLIKGLQSEKNTLISQLGDITKEINNSLGGVFSQGATEYSVPMAKMFQGNGSISDFLNDTRTQAALTSAEIEKLISSLQSYKNIDLESVTKYVEQFSSVQETYKRLSDLTGLDKNNKDYQSLANIYGQIIRYKEQLSSDPRSWTPEENAHLQSLINTFTQYGNILADVGEKEARYFANKSRYSQDRSKGEIQQVADDTKKLLDVQKQMEEAAKGIAGREGLGSPIITNFAQGADGIFRLDFSALDEATGALRTFRVEMGSVTEGMFENETTINKSFENIKSASKQLQSVGDLITKLGKTGFDISENTAEPKIQKILDLYRQLSAELNKGENADQGQISKLVADSKLAAAEVEKLYNTHMKLQNAMATGNAKKLGDVNLDGDIYKQMTDSINAFVAASGGANAKIGAFNETTGQIKFTMEAADGTVQHFTASLDKLGKQAIAQQTGVTQLKTTWEKFTDGIKGTGKQFLTAVFGANAFYTAIRQVKQGYQYVKEIDLAMTELKKVTNETDLAYDNFLGTASKSAAQIGTTISDFTNATSNFARLGYTMEESAEMAKAAIVYKNVADGLDTVEASTESIISTMKAFGIESTDVMSIVDKFNEVGNNFAITSAGIGEALQRSASALYSAGNTIDESVALVTAAM